MSPEALLNKLQLIKLFPGTISICKSVGQEDW